jgi:hypothetical protein
MSDWQKTTTNQPFQTTDTKPPAFPQTVKTPTGDAFYSGGGLTPIKKP